MKNFLITGSMLVAGCLLPLTAGAQLSTNPDKFLGNITTSGQVNGGGIEFASLWNQMTAENETKWSSCEGSHDRFTWGGADNCYNYCKEHNIPFKFHTLVWGSQYPSWMDDYNGSVQYKEIEQWMNAVKERYPDLPLIDVVNEAIPGHAPAPFKNALGGDGVTGYDWIIKAFEMAHERWPDAILIYNDYNTFQWQKTEFINLVKTIRDAGAPVDAYGCQSHDLTDIGFSTFKSAMADIQKQLAMPMYSTEYDIGTADDQKQLRQYRDQISYMWEQPYVAGITLWGYIYGRTWVTDGNSGIIKDGVDRPAMTWLREYMATDVAKTAPSPYPGGVKEASLYIRPAKKTLVVDKPNEIFVDARLRTKTIDHIDFYLNDQLYETLTAEPYVVTVTPTNKKDLKFKAVLYDTEGNTWERLGSAKIAEERKPFHDAPIQLPGVIECEDFDCGGERSSFHDSDTKDEGGAKYRTDNGGVDIGVGNGGYVIGHTATGEWLDYTVNIESNGKYYLHAVVSSGSDGSSFQISRVAETGNVDITNVIDVPNTGSWDEYVTITEKFNQRLSAGEHTFRITITGPYVNLDKIYIDTSSGIDGIEADIDGVCQVYTTTGIYLGDVEGEDFDEIKDAVRALTGQKAIYVVRSISTGNSRVIAL